MNVGIILLVVLLVLALGGLPRFGFHRYGYAPSGLLGTVLVIVLILVLLGHL